MDLSQHEEADSLEKNDDVSETTPISELQKDSDSTTPASGGNKDGDDKKTGKKDNPDKVGFLKKIVLIFRHFDIYFLGFIFIIMVATIVLALAINHNASTNKTVTGQTETLSPSAVSQLNNTDSSVGGSSETLEIQSNTIFTNNVLMKGNLDVAGELKLGGALNLPGISVSGTTDLDQVNVAGSENIAGTLTVNAGLAVTGAVSFSGSVSIGTLDVSNLQLTGDILISHHIVTSGGIPRFSGLNLGGGGTGSVNGSDTAGTINLSIVGVSGCLAHINFATGFNSTPHVVATLVGSSSTTINSLGTLYLSDLTSTGFSVCISGTGTGAFNIDYTSID